MRSRALAIGRREQASRAVWYFTLPSGRVPTAIPFTSLIVFHPQPSIGPQPGPTSRTNQEWAGAVILLDDRQELPLAGDPHFIHSPAPESMHQPVLSLSLGFSLCRFSAASRTSVGDFVFPPSIRRGASTSHPLSSRLAAGKKTTFLIGCRTVVLLSLSDDAPFSFPFSAIFFLCDDLFATGLDLCVLYHQRVIKDLTLEATLLPRIIHASRHTAMNYQRSKPCPAPHWPSHTFGTGPAALGEPASQLYLSLKPSNRNVTNQRRM